MDSSIKSIFQSVQQPLHMEDLISLTRDKYQEVLEHHPELPLHEEMEEMLRAEGLDINKMNMATNGLYPFWYIDGYAFIPLPSLHPEVLKQHSVLDWAHSENKKLSALWDDGSFELFFSRMNQHFGFAYFLLHLEEIPVTSRYDAFRSLYVKNEYGFQNIDRSVIRSLFSIKQNRAFAKELRVDDDGMLTIYRGVQDLSSNPIEAYSWTVSFRVALYFATRFNSTKSAIYKAKVHISNVVDYINSRNEHEILLLPETLQDVANMGYLNLDEEMISNLEQAGFLATYHSFAFRRLKSQWFHKPDGIHGKRHIKRVLFQTVLMSYFDNLSPSDQNILSYAAIWHDIGRTNDDRDDGHGMKSVRKMEALHLKGSGMSDADREIVKFIMIYHALPDEVGLNKLEKYRPIEDKIRAKDLFLRFKDCDGLDRVRLGDLDARYLRTETGKKLLIVAYQLLRNLE